jgi:predicted metal-dependent hydrolase
MAPAKEHISIQPRHYHFDLQATLKTDWFGGSPFKTAFFNALSLQFPEGEHLFIHAVRQFRERITDSRLKEEVRGFIGQEAIHSREHVHYNQALRQRGYDLQKLEARFHKQMTFVKTLPADVQLAGTCGAEHITAVLAHLILTNPGWMDGVPPDMQRLWQWHALEETEHKAVAFDVFQEQVADTRMRRVVFFYVLFDFFKFTTINMLHMLHHDGQLFKWQVWRDGIAFLWGKEGLLRRSMPLLRRYFRKDFHPWQHDNHTVMRLWQEQFHSSLVEHSPA